MFKTLIVLSTLFTSATAQDYLCSTNGGSGGNAVSAGDMWDGGAVVTAVCRAAANGCDVAESCDGSSTDCPGDLFAPSSVEARAATTACDVAEMCSGTDDVIAADVFALSSVEARPAVGSCDVAEMCSGTDDVIPFDVHNCYACSSDGTSGGSAVGAGDMWDGGAVVTAVCRAATSTCDVAESCDGVSLFCPADGFASNIVIARAATTACDVAEMCSGTDAVIPADTFAANSVIARDAASGCDIAEMCSGVDSVIPADVSAACVTYSWDAPAFPECPTACGAAETTQSRAVACLGSDGSLADVLPEAACTEEMPTESQTCPAAAACGSATVKIVSAATYDDIGMDSLAEPAARAQFEGDFKAAVVTALPTLALAEADVTIDAITAKVAEGQTRRLASFKLRRLAEASSGVVVTFSIAVPAAGAAAAEAVFVDEVQGKPSALAVEHRGALALPAAVTAPTVVEVEQPPGPDPAPKTTSGAEGTSVLLASLLAAALAHAL